MRGKVKKLLIIWLACLVCISAATSDQSEEKHLKSAQLMQPYHRVEQASGCEFYIEEFCFARLCDGYIQLGLNSNLDFSPLQNLDDREEEMEKNNIMVKDENELISFGTYKNGILDMLKIPFFKHDGGGVENDD